MIESQHFPNYFQFLIKYLLTLNINRLFKLTLILLKIEIKYIYLLILFKDTQFQYSE